MNISNNSVALKLDNPVTMREVQVPGLVLSEVLRNSRLIFMETKCEPCECGPLTTFL